MSLWVPPRVSRELQASTDQYRNEVLNRARHRAVIDRFNPELRRVDPYLEMVWFDEDVTDVFGVMPARYHLLRNNPDAPPSLEPICGPGGEFMEPNSGLFEWLRRSDMWNASAREDRERAQREAERAAERAREREREDVEEEFRDRYNAAFRTSVSMSPDAAWSQSSKGRRGRAGYRRAA